MTALIFWLINTAAWMLLCYAQRSTNSRKKTERSAVANGIRLLGGLLAIVAACGLSISYQGAIGILLWLGTLPIITLMLSALAAFIAHRLANISVIKKSKPLCEE